MFAHSISTIYEINIYNKHIIHKAISSFLNDSTVRDAKDTLSCCVISFHKCRFLDPGGMATLYHLTLPFLTTHLCICHLHHLTNTPLWETNKGVLFSFFPISMKHLLLLPPLWTGYDVKLLRFNSYYLTVLWEFTAPRSKSGFSRCLLFYVLPFDECFLSLATTIIPKALPISTSAEPGNFFFQAEPVVGNKQLLLICHWFSKLRVPLPWELFSAFESKHSNPWQALLGCHSIFGTSECHRWHHITSSTIRQETCLQNLAFPYTFPKLFTLKKAKAFSFLLSIPLSVLKPQWKIQW